jgi:RHS repeat-associated protein
MIFSPTLTLENAVRYAFDRGVVLVAAVGNDNGPVLYPAAYDDFVLGVAATDHNDQRAPFSNFGPEVDVAAPGVDIFSSWFDNTYATKSGTSAAAPFATGLAALILSQNPTFTPDQVMSQIKSTSQDVNQATLPGEDDHLGSGRINAYNALTLAPAPQGITQATVTYTYDLNGNQIQKSVQIGQSPNPSISQYSYDFENRLTRITYPQGAPSEYTYDGLGKRISTTESGVTTRYLYDGLNAILERDPLGKTQASYTRGLSYGGGIGGILSALRGSQRSHYHYDGLGSVTGLTDSASKATQIYTYDAFGNLLTQAGQVPNPYRFSSKEYSPTSGLVYFGARYYDPRIGRFITKDPLTWGPDDPRALAVRGTPAHSLAQELISSVASINPQAFHAYVYAGNNPVNYIDPYGLTQKPWGEKFAEGYYFGTGYGEEATMWYVQRYNETGYWYYWLGGATASLWTPDTWFSTATTLAGAAAGPRLAHAAFRPGGWLNRGQYLRIGWGRHQGRVFRIAGDWISRIRESGKIDLWRGGS